MPPLRTKKKASTKERALEARRKKEAQIIADLLDSPSKRRGSTRRLSAGRRRLAVESESSESESEDDGESSALSSDEDDNDDDAVSVGSSSSSGQSDHMDTTFSDASEHSSDEETEDTAITSDEDYESDSTDGEGEHRKKSKRRARGGEPGTPRKRRRLDGSDALTTPRKREAILETVTSTPHLPARSLNMTTLTLQELEGLSPQARAKKVLHVGATPERLPCREVQYEEVMACIEDAVQDGIGGCVYVSGVPGVGKTATVREAIRSLKQRVKGGLISPFKFVEINGMKLNDAQDAYSLLWQTLTGSRCSNRMALRQLSHYFGRSSNSNSSSSMTTVVLMDELDQLVTTRQEVMYNMFNWPNSKNSRLIVVAVANTMDLPERILNPKVASRLGMTRITFKPYNDLELVKIVKSRLGMLDEDKGQRSPVEQALVQDCDTVFKEDAFVYVAKRVNNVSGDARRMLDVCRRAIDSVEMQTKPGCKPKEVTIMDVMRVLDSMVKSGKGFHLIKLPLQAKVTLISILTCTRRSGIAEIDLATILAHQKTLCRMQAIPIHLTLDTISTILSQLCALGLLIAVGTGAGNGKSGMYARFLLACQEDEVRLAFEQDPRLRNMM
jgi:origin recognition complex subunit 1